MDIKFNHRPSSLGTHITCRAKALMEHGMANEETEYTREGNHAHTLLNYCLYHKIVDVDVLIGRTIRYAEFENNDPLAGIKEEHTFEVTPKMAEDIGDTLRHIRLHAPSEDVIKTEMVIPNAMIKNGATSDLCTVDVVFYDEDEKRLYVMDYKNGTTPVDSNNNWQMMSYAYSVYDNFDLPDVESVNMRILQPNSRNGVKQSAWEITVDELKDKVKEARSITQEIDDGKNITFNPHSSACAFCKAKAFCKALNNEANEEYNMLEQELKTFKKENALPLAVVERAYNAGKRFEDMANSTTVNLKAIAEVQELLQLGYVYDSMLAKLQKSTEDVDMPTVSEAAQRQHIIDAIAEFKKLQSNAKTYLLHLASIGDEEVNFTIQEKLGRRTFISFDKDAKGKEFKGVLEENQLLDVKPMTLAQMKKKLGSDEAVNSLLGEYIKQSVSTELVPKESRKGDEKLFDM